MLNHLATLQQTDIFSIFKAYFHRLLREYGVEATGVDNIHQHLINSKNDLFLMDYVTYHHGRKLTALYTKQTLETVDIILGVEFVNSCLLGERKFDGDVRKYYDWAALFEDTATEMTSLIG